MRKLPHAAIVAITLAVAACSPAVTVHGYVPPAEELAEIRPGVDTRATVEQRIGRPANFGLLRDSDWYYVQTTMEQLTYNPPRPTDREVVAIAFSDSGVVETIERYGLEDGRVVPLSPRVTPTGGQRRNILRQIFAGILNFDASSILGG